MIASGNIRRKFPIPFMRAALPGRLCLCLLVCALTWTAAPGAVPQAESAGFGVGFGRGYYGWPHTGYHRGYWPRHRYWSGHRGWYDGSWIGLSMPIYPRRYYERGSVTPVQPFPDIEVHKPPLPHTYQERGLGLDSIAGSPEQRPSDPPLAAARDNPPHAGSTQPVIYPVMTRESREAWERYQRWIRGSVPAPGKP